MTTGHQNPIAIRHLTWVTSILAVSYACHMPEDGAIVVVVAAVVVDETAI